MKMKRIVSFLITFAMLFTMMPNIAFAREGDTYIVPLNATVYRLKEASSSTNKHSCAEYLWQEDNAAYIAVSTMHGKKVEEATINIEGQKTYTGTDIATNEQYSSLQVGTKTISASTKGGAGHYWRILKFSGLTLKHGSQFRLTVDTKAGGHDIDGVGFTVIDPDNDNKEPTLRDLRTSLLVKVECESEGANGEDHAHEPHEIVYGYDQEHEANDLFNESNFTIEPVDDSGIYKVTMTGRDQLDKTNPGSNSGISNFVAVFNVNTDETHKVEWEGGKWDITDTFYVKWDEKEHSWMFDDEADEDDFDDEPVTFEIDVVCTPLTPSPELEVVKELTKVTRAGSELTSVPKEVQVGDTLTYTITVKNTGSAEATGVSVEDVLTVDYEQRQVTWSEDSNDDTSFELQQNDEKKFTVTYTVQKTDAGKTLSNVATAKVGNDEKASSNPVTTKVAPQYAIEKTVVDENGTSVDTIHTIYQVGDLVYYKITVGSTNGTWPQDKTVEVSDPLPTGLELVGAEALDKESVRSLSKAQNKVVAEVTAPGSILITAKVLASYDAEYNNIASVNDGDPNTKDDPKTVLVPIKVAALDVQKTLMDNGKVYNVGDTVKYQITFENIGNVTLREFKITDAVPEGLKIVDSAWENGKFIGQLADELKPDEQKTVVVEAKITDHKDSYSNTATVAAEVAVDGRPVTKDATNTELKVKPNDIKPDHNVKVQYVLEDGTIISEIDLNAAHDASWKVSVSNAENLVDVSNLAVARTVEQNGKHYVFKEFRNDELSGTVTKDVQIVAVYGLDEIGGGINQTQPDGVPDEYQATVTYRVVNGTWSDGTELERTEVFDLYSFDDVAAKWVQIPNVTLGNTIPKGMKAVANYVGQRGAWNEDITSETAVTENVTYVYRFGDAAADKIVVYYKDDGSGYGEVTSAPYQVFTENDWTSIEDDNKHVEIHLTATARDNGGRTYFDEWRGSLVDNLDRDITENEELDVPVKAEIGQTYTIIADFGRNSGGGAHHPDARDDDDDDNDRDDEDDTEESIDEEVPLAETLWLNTEDHYAYIVGYSEDGTVRPNANITRAEVATIFFRLLTDEARDQFWMTSNNFSDVLPNDWYNNAVSTMVNMGIIQGYEDGTFRPNANITRAEFAAIASRFMSSGYDVEEDLFTDIANHWARENINDAAMTQWIHGYPDGTFLPDQAITRAEAVTLVNNVLQRKPDADHMLDSMIKWPDNPESAWYYEAIQEATNSHDYDLFEDAEYETWTALQENRDWAALEKDWVNTHRTGGEVA